MIFFIIGSVNYSNSDKTIKDTAWITSSEGPIDIYFGLRTAYANVGLVSLGGKIKYSDQACFTENCDICDKAGKGAFGLTVVAAVFSVICLALSAAALPGYDKGIQIANVFVAFIAFGASLGAILLFMAWCGIALDKGYDELIDRTDDAFGPIFQDDGGTSESNPILNWGPGSIITIIGTIMMFFVLAFQVTAVIFGEKGYVPPAPQNPPGHTQSPGGSATTAGYTAPAYSVV